MTTATAIQGIWTPWAKVLCYKCHGATFDRGFGSKTVLTDEQMASYETEYRSPGPDEGICPCDDCSRPIVVRDDVAWLAELKVALEKHGLAPELEQTGGMCAALYIPIRAGAFFMYATGMDDWCACLYMGDRDDDSVWEDPIDVRVEPWRSDDEDGPPIPPVDGFVTDIVAKIDELRAKYHSITEET